jgi:hypothetical protein
MNAAQQEIFEAALEIKDDAERKAMLERACAGDAHLRARIEELLASQGEADRFFTDCVTAIAASTEELTPCEGPSGGHCRAATVPTPRQRAHTAWLGPQVRE